jgi:hypothetical protein
VVPAVEDKADDPLLVRTQSTGGSERPLPGKAHVLARPHEVDRPHLEAERVSGSQEVAGEPGIPHADHALLLFDCRPHIVEHDSTHAVVQGRDLELTLLEDGARLGDVGQGKSHGLAGRRPCGLSCDYPSFRAPLLEPLEIDPEVPRTLPPRCEEGRGVQVPGLGLASDEGRPFRRSGTAQAMLQEVGLDLLPPLGKMVELLLGEAVDPYSPVGPHDNPVPELAKEPSQVCPICCGRQREGPEHLPLLEGPPAPIASLSHIHHEKVAVQVGVRLPVGLVLKPRRDH